MALKLSLQLLSITAITFLFSGCCISPIDEDIDSTQVRYFSGFTVDGDELISIQAADPETYEWETITTVRPSTRRSWRHWYSGATPIYRWSRRVHIPSKYWYNDSLVISIDDTPVRTINKVCHIRMVDSTNNVLRTYKQPLTEEELRHGNPVDIFMEKGNTKEHLNLQLLVD